jgi:hypothetical protein
LEKSKIALALALFVLASTIGGLSILIILAFLPEHVALGFATIIGILLLKRKINARK